MNSRLSSPSARRRLRAAASALGLLLACHGGAAAEPGAHPSLAAVGIPYTRSYSLDEIGVSRGARLGFDRIGRLAVYNGREYVVLNDASWIDIAAKEPDQPPLLAVANDASGRSFFGSLANWGELARSEDGLVRPTAFRPDDCPAWVMSSNFEHVLPQDDAVYFAGMNGLVRWDRATGEHAFLEAPDISTLFALGGRLYVSSHSLGTLRLDEERWAWRAIPLDDGRLVAIDQFAELAEGRALISTSGWRLLEFDGEGFSEWTGPLGSGRASGHINKLARLADGGVAIAIDGQGVYLIGADGSCRLGVTTPDYLRIKDMAASEPGVLWLSSEGSVQRLLYGNPVSVVDQRLGVSIDWPQAVEWEGKPLVATNGALYEIIPAPDGLSTRFEPMQNQPGRGVMAVEARGPHLLIGNGEGVFERRDGVFAPTSTTMKVNRLEFVGPDVCFALNATEIAALRWDGERWREAARAPGVGHPFISHSTSAAAWIELGLDRAARVALVDGRIETRLFERFPWPDPTWVSIGTLGDLVVMTGTGSKRLFFDDLRGALREEPELEEMFANAPAPITRVVQDPTGTIWAAHERGVMTIDRAPAGYRYDEESLRLVRENFPLIQLLPSGPVWISTGTALYHVYRDFSPPYEPPLQPLLTAVADGRTGEQLVSAYDAGRRPEPFPFSRNNLVFKFFAGGYSSLRAPSYEFSMRGGSQRWRIRSADSFINLPHLREGAYTLSAQLLDAGAPRGRPVVSTFVVEPPWFRAPAAYALYWAGAIVGGCAIGSWLVRRTKRKQRFLEDLVRDRTEELRSTMEQLSEEARNAATLAERNRLAGEIHDSIQQGLSGLILQLDATLKRPGLAPDVHSRLSVARNMVSFTRHEVQRAVWDLESPYLDDADLGEALSRMAEHISAGARRVEVETVGEPLELDPSTKHHFLRIAQEAIANAVRHGHASRIQVRLEYRDGATILEVSDDGKGFVPREVFSNEFGHFGLRGLKARAAKIDGDLQILSEPGRGATIRVQSPASLARRETAHAIRQD